jgi:hypothetical protein
MELESGVYSKPLEFERFNPVEFDGFEMEADL